MTAITQSSVAPSEAIYRLSRAVLETEYRAVLSCPTAMDLTDLSDNELLAVVLEHEMAIDWNAEERGARKAVDHEPHH
jgi:hypothetical protein